MNSKPLIVPMVPYLPMHHGLTVFCMAVAGYFALALLVYFIRTPAREIF